MRPRRSTPPAAGRAASASSSARPVPILPQRHMALVAHLPRTLDYVMPSVMDYIPATGDYGLYFRHESPEHLIAGLHTEEAIHDLVDPDNFGRSDEHDYMERVAEKFAAAPARPRRGAARERVGGPVPDQPRRAADRRPLRGPRRRLHRRRRGRLGPPAVAGARPARGGVDRPRRAAHDQRRAAALRPERESL